MKNSDIKYTTSRDYDRLLELLMEGNIVIGFIAINFNNKPNFQHSRLIEMRYSSNHKYLDVGVTIFLEDFDKGGIIQYFQENNVQYIPIA